MMFEHDDKTTRQLAARLSLRRPQAQSLEILARILGQLELRKDPDLSHWRQVIQADFPALKDFEREFPSLCFALATGVGKTRLMGAMIAWLFLTGRSRHFLVLAPNLTIYDKLKRDFLLGSPKYVFSGIPELAQTPPVIITGDDYTEGRGVRLDYALPATLSGDLFGAETAPHINIFNISKINARDNKPGAAQSSVARVRRFQEYLGDSYFSYLAGLPDLVVLMDEAHRYYASAGARAINDLRPVLGIELTATPKTVGAKPRDFKNIVYHYPLAAALNDGYVKIPAVATRKDFRAQDYDAGALEKIKLEDGVHHHEYVKAELETYANNSGGKAVKPFMLVVAQDTTHAGQIKALLESEQFFQGAYKDKVIEVHSNQSGEESDEAMQRLLAVEYDAHTEIVIHVNKLKEGWDVTNLYTIVPLRASASEILTEQTIGRGLRLPYGKRAGVDAVDRLTIIAHDRFQEIVDRANDAHSIIKKTLYIGDGGGEDEIPQHRPQVITAPSLAEMLATGARATLDEKTIHEDSGQYQTASLSAAEQKIAEIALRVVGETARGLDSSRQLGEAKIQQAVLQQVRQAAREVTPTQTTLLGMDNALDAAHIEALVHQVTQAVAAQTIDIPRIVVLPTREVNYGFQDFDLEHLERIRHQPVSHELLLQHLEDNRVGSIHWSRDETREARPEDYLVRHLMDWQAVDYDQHAALLYKLAGQMVAHLRSYLGDEAAVENVLRYWRKSLADFIQAQMQAHIWTTPTDYIGKVTQGFELLKPVSFTLAAGEQPRPFRAPVQDKQRIRQMVFGGFKKCCYPYQKFDSVDGEWRLAQVLEDDAEVLRWMKPAPGQFRIEYHSGRAYEPDFVVETRQACWLIEPKRADELDKNEVRLKTKAARQWCCYANEHAAHSGGKRWEYLLLAHDAIHLGQSVAGLRALAG
jgi:type III restriction enzyme